MQRPKKARTQRKRVSDEMFRQILIKELAKPDSEAHLKTNFFQLLQTKYSIDKTRALRLHDKYYSEIIEGRNKKLEDEATAEEEKFIKSQISGKNNHAMEMIETIKEMEVERENLKNIKKGAVKVGEQIIITTDSDVIAAKRAIISINAEIRNIRTQIGKWYGFEAPKKLDHTSKGESINQPQIQRVRVVVKEK